jgi:hypothetical protein
MPETRQKLTRESLGIADGLPLQVSDGGLEELRRDVQMLMDIEAIKQLKHAYFRCVDTANLEELGTLFHDDVSVHFVGGTYEWKVKGKEDYLANIGYSFNKASVGHHNGHQPEIRMLSDREATGVWYLADHMWILNHEAKTYGTALYWDRYVKEDGRWLILETCYERLFEINETGHKPDLSSHYLGAHGTDVPG